MRHKLTATRAGFTIMMEAQFTGPSYWDHETGKIIIFPTREEAEATLATSLEVWRADQEDDEDDYEDRIASNAREALGEWVVPCIEYSDGSLYCGLNEEEDWLGQEYSPEFLLDIRSEWSSYQG